MGISINSNIAAINAKHQLNKTQTGLSKTFEKLSSGLKINRAGDDAAGLAISERFSSRLRGISQAIRNANDAVSLSNREEALKEAAHAISSLKAYNMQGHVENNASIQIHAQNTGDGGENMGEAVDEIVGEVVNEAVDETSSLPTVTDEVEDTATTDSDQDGGQINILA